MKKLLLVLLLFAWLPTPVSSQTIDNLYEQVANMPADTNKVMALRQLFRALYAEDRKEALLEVADKGLTLSRNLKFEKGIDLFIFYKASALDILGRGQESIQLFEEGLAMATKNGNFEAIADYQINLGTARHNLGDFEQSLENFLAAYQVYKTQNQPENLSKVLNNIGLAYSRQHKFDRAKAIYEESLAIKQALKDTLGMAATLQNLATLYSSLEQHPEASANLEKALAFYENLNRPDDVAGCYSLLGQLYFNTGALPSAKIALQKALLYYEKKPNPEYAPNTYYLLGVLANAEKDYPNAEIYLNLGLGLAKQYGHKERVFEILRELSKTEYFLGKYAKAYESLREASAIRDAVVEEKRLSLMEEMQAKFDVAQKDSALKINQLDLKQRTQERNWLIAAAFLLFFLSIVIFFGLRSRIKANKKIATQESALQRQQIFQLEQESKLNILSAMITGQEKERERIANDLHDGLGGQLSAVKSHFNALPTPEKAQDLFRKTNRLIDDACIEVRRIAHNMMPKALAFAGLSGALEDLAQDLEKQGIQCTLEMIDMDIALKETQSVTIYRIIQELTANVVKHAQADQLLLQLIRRDNSLTIIAEDNGKGFNVPQAFAKKGLGLSSIESRVKFLQGNVEWDSVPGEGTLVCITIPM